MTCPPRTDPGGVLHCSAYAVVRESATGKELQRIALDDAPTGVVFGPGDGCWSPRMAGEGHRLGPADEGEDFLPANHWVQSGRYHRDDERRAPPAVATSVSSDTVQVWNLSGMQDFRSELKSKYSTTKKVPVEGIGIAGRRLVSWGGGTAIVWDLASDRQLSSVPGQCAALSPGGRLLAVCVSGEAGAGASVHLCDAETGEVKSTFQQQTSLVQSLAFSPDGTLIACVCRETMPDGTGSGGIHLWNAANGICVATLRRTAGDQGTVSFGADGSWLAEGAAVWDFPGGRLRHDFGGYSRISAIGRDAKRLACADGSVSGRVVLYDLVGGKLAGELQCGSMVQAIAFTAEGDRVIVACGDEAVRFWDVATMQSILNLRQSAGVTALAVSQDGALVALGYSNGCVSTLEAAPPDFEVGLIEPGGSLGDGCRVPTVARSPAPGRVAIGTASGVGVWDLPAGRQVPSSPGSGPASSVALDPDGTLLAVCFGTFTTRSVRVWDLKAGRTCWERLDAHGADAPYGVAFVEKGRLLAVSNSGYTGGRTHVQFYDSGSGRFVREFRFDDDRGGPLTSSPMETFLPSRASGSPHLRLQRRNGRPSPSSNV